MVNGSVKPCCQDQRNLETIENKSHVLVKRCTVCGCRHFRAFMSEPGRVPILGTDTKG